MQCNAVQYSVVALHLYKCMLLLSGTALSVTEKELN